MRFVVHLLWVCLAGWLGCRPPKQSQSPSRRRSLSALLFAGNVLLGCAGYWLASELSLALPLSAVVGRWVVLNGDEPQLMAVWELSKAPPAGRPQGPLRVRGAICLAEEDGRSDDPSTWCGLADFGPHPAQLDTRAGKVEFDYSSNLGAGKVRLTLAQAYLGQLRDDPSKTEAAQADASSVALVREGERGKHRRRAHRIGSLWILFWTSLAGALALRLIRRRTKLDGVLARWLLFATLTLGLCAFSGKVLGVAREARGIEPGDRWLLDYLSRRARVGNLEAVEDQKPLHLRGTLSTRQRVGRGSFESGPLDYQLLRGRLRFDYQAEVGTGSAQLVRTRALYGYFFDVISRGESSPVETLVPHPCPRACKNRPSAGSPEPNFGDLVAFREELPLGNLP